MGDIIASMYFCTSISQTLCNPLPLSTRKLASLDSIALMCFTHLSDQWSRFQKVLFALCALNALTTTVCLVAAALRYLQIFASRRPCIVSVRKHCEVF